MKIFVPTTGEMEGADARLIHLAEFMGVSCEPILIQGSPPYTAVRLDSALERSCFVVNAQFWRKCTSGVVPADLVSRLASSFAYLLVHGLDGTGFSANLLAVLSNGLLRSVSPVKNRDGVYRIAAHSKDICGDFSGLSFGPVNPDNDQILSAVSEPAIRTLISIDGQPLMAVVQQPQCEILIVAGKDVVDLNTEAGEAPVAQYFSRLIPYVMALRHIAEEECWRGWQRHASVIIDDPLLRENYGFLNFDSLLHLTKQHNFHTAIAFIPHNFRRNARRITRMFLENPDRLSICFHGNDHTAAELASTDGAFVNTLLAAAENRMESHLKTTELSCDKVMVFPQSKFSREAMKVLKCRGFHAAVNTGSDPMQEQVRVSIGELAQPAILRYGGFPLFTRKNVKEIESQDVAFNLFFGRPLLIHSHHEVFKTPEALIETIRMVNSLAPGISWSSVGRAVRSSFLRRRAADGTVYVRAYSTSIQIENESDAVERFAIEWCEAGQASATQILRDGKPCRSLESGDSKTVFSVELPSGTSNTFSLVFGNPYPSTGNLGLRWNTRALIRRRLSEIRDNYLSKNEYLLGAAEKFHRRIRK